MVDIIASAPATSSAARHLVESAVKAWKIKYPTSRTDDCAAVCLFLQTETPNDPPNNEVSKQEFCRLMSFDHLDTGCSGSDENDSLIQGDDDDWRAPQGVARVDTLMSLPTFIAANKQQPASIKTQNRA